MTKTVEPNWVQYQRVGETAFEEEFDLNANPNATEQTKWRHRQRRYTGETVAEWMPGRVPRLPEARSTEDIFMGRYVHVVADGATFPFSGKKIEVTDSRVVTFEDRVYVTEKVYEALRDPSIYDPSTGFLNDPILANLSIDPFVS